MVFPRQSGTWLLCTSMLLLSLLPDAQSSAQAPTEYQVKAAYVYNFAKFIEWPFDQAAQADSPLRLCVLDDKQFELTLRDVVNGKSVGPHPVTVMSVHAAGQARSCRILFISSSHSKEAAHVVEELKDTSVVTVGEMEGFVEAGGIINFVLYNDHVHFQVNEKAAEHAGVHVSSRLLNVARLVVR